MPLKLWQKIGLGVAGAGALGFGASKLLRGRKRKKGFGASKKRKSPLYWRNRYEGLKWKKKYYNLRFR